MRESSSVRWITQLPYTICLDILFLLPTKDFIRLHRVSRDTRTLITNYDVLARFLKMVYPQTIEARVAGNMSLSQLRQTDWLAVLDTVYHRDKTLRCENDWNGVSSQEPRFKLLGRPSQLHPHRNVVRHGLRTTFTWSRDAVIVQRYDETMWTYAAEDSLLVYPTNELQELLLVAEDLETLQVAIVPFNFSGKMLRRIRLRHRVLILEWCHSIGSWVRGTVKLASSHFVSAFRVTTSVDNGRLPLNHGREQSPWVFTPCGEWKLSETPLMLRDTVYSAHNQTHYVCYMWKTSPCFRTTPHSCLNEREDREACCHEEIAVWQFNKQREHQQANQADRGALLVRSWIQHKLLRFWRQIDADLAHVVDIALDDCTWDDNTQSVCGQLFVHHEQTRRHSVKWVKTVCATGIPLTGIGPMWKDECQTCWDAPRPGYHWSAQSFDMARAPCWRHQRPHDEMVLSRVFDQDAQLVIAVMFPTYGPQSIQRWMKKSYICCLSAGRKVHEGLIVKNKWLDFPGKGQIEGDSRRLVGNSKHGLGPRIVQFI